MVVLSPEQVEVPPVVVVQRFPIRVAAAVLAGTALFVGLAGRFWFWSHRGLWNDEIFSLARAVENRGRFFDFVVEGRDVHPPVYYVWLRGVSLVAVGIDTEAALRLSGLVPWAVALGAIAIMWRRGAVSTLGAALLVAFTSMGPAAFYVSVEVRMYGWVSALQLVFVVALLDGPGTRRHQVAVGAVMAGGFLVSYLAVVPMLAVLAVNVVADRRWRWRAALTVSIVPVSVAVVWAPIVLKQMDRGASYVTTSAASREYLWLAGGWLTVAALVAVLVSVLRPDEAGDVRQRRGLVTLAGAGCAWVLFQFAATVTGENVVTLGHAVSLATVAAAGVAMLVSDRVIVAVILSVGVLATLPALIDVIDDPAVVSANRTSPADDLFAVLDDHPDWSGDAGSGLGVIHVEWYEAGQHLVNRSLERYPKADLRTAQFREADKIARAVEDLRGDRIVLYVSRIGPQPGPWEMEPVGRGVWLVT